MDKYAQPKRLDQDHRLQVYMYAFIYVYPETMPVDEHFPATKMFSDKYNNISTPGPVPRH